MALLGRPAGSPVDAGIAGDRHGDPRVLLVAAALSAIVAAAVGAAALGAPDTALAASFTFAMPVLPALAWWAFARSPADLRRFWFLVASGVTLWLAGSLVWYVAYRAAGYVDPGSPGPWDAVFLLAYAAVLVGVYHGLRDALPLRQALLDVSVVVAAGLAVGVALVGRELAAGITLEALATVARPLFGLAVVTLVASAVLGAWREIWLSVLLFGAGQAFFTAGSVLFSYGVEAGRVADRWADLAWLAGTATSMLAAALAVLSLDRPVRLAARPRIPGTAAAGAVLLVGLAALGVAAGVIVYAAAAGGPAVLAAGVLAAVWIGTAMALRARNAIGALEVAYTELDRAHLALERVSDALAAANHDLARANAEIRAVHGAFEDLLAIADEQTQGAMSDLIEETGAELAAMLEDYRARERGGEPDG
jgi:two-component system, cell cycle response regulator